MFGSLLSGATGALGFGGGVGSSGNGQDSGGSVASTLQQTIDPSVTTNSGHGPRGSVTVNTAFPGGKVSSSSDINPPTAPGAFQMSLVAGGVVAFLFVLVLIGKR